MAWHPERARTVVDIPLAPATSLRVARRAVLAVVGEEVLRVDLSSGRTTEVLKAACEPPCGLVLCG